MVPKLLLPLSILLGIFLQFALGLDVQATVWKTPDGRSTDLALTFTNGQTIPLVWNNVSSQSLRLALVTDTTFSGHQQSI